jgi:MoxR-like ATPase
MTATSNYVDTITAQVRRHVFGLDATVRALAMAQLARGHALLQGPPGIGKTLLARTFAQTIGGAFQRIQGTPDLTPRDITGVTIFRPDGSEFEFREGPLFTDVLLIDELNRCNPKTQSALLQAMEERRVTVERESRELSSNFVVVATQNPMDFEGTYPLPESQIDRFLIRMDLQYIDREHEAMALETHAKTAIRSLDVEPVAPTLLDSARAEIDACRVDRTLIDYVLDIVTASRQREEIALGLSTRAARALVLMARINACCDGFAFVRPDDVQAVAPWVIAHRLILTSEAILEGQQPTELARDLVSAVAVPRTAEQEPLDSAPPA